MIVCLPAGKHPRCSSRAENCPWHKGVLAEVALSSSGRFAALDNLVTLTVRAADSDERYGPCLRLEAMKTMPSVTAISVHLHFETLPYHHWLALQGWPCVVHPHPWHQNTVEISL